MIKNQEKLQNFKVTNVHIIVKYWLPPILWALVIFSFSSIQVGGTTEVYWKDFIVKKTAHLVEYGILAILLYRALLNSNVNKQRAFVFSILIAGFYGITDEFHQSFTPGRGPSARDVIIDTIGATIGVSMARNSPKLPTFINP